MLTDGIFFRDHTNSPYKFYMTDTETASRLQCYDPDPDPAAPHYMLPNAREIFDQCLQRLDRFAETHCGVIRAEFTRATHTSVIQIELPCLSFELLEDCDILTYVSMHMKKLEIKKTETGLLLFLRIHCFAPVPVEEAGEK